MNKMTKSFLPSPFELAKAYLSQRGLSEMTPLGNIKRSPKNEMELIISLTALAYMVLEVSKHKKPIDLITFNHSMDHKFEEISKKKMAAPSLPDPDSQRVTLQEAIDLLNKNASNKKDKIKSEAGLLKALKKAELVTQEHCPNLTVSLLKKYIQIKNEKRRQYKPSIKNLKINSLEF